MKIIVISVRNHKLVDPMKCLRDFFNRQRIADMEKKATLIAHNPAAKAAFIIAVALLMCAFTPGSAVAVAADPFGRIEAVFWPMVKKFARVAFMVMGGIEIVKKAASGDTKSIGQVIFKYIVAFAGLDLIPWGIGLVDGAFTGR
ncbi:MAG: hypothetical protein Q8933_09320 [Bacteroidota bacterium]|nr:hypothetical protein [Bacteroidota bacterium]